MDINNYKKILNEKGIKLFDYQYRLSFFKINLVTNNNYNNQIGGGDKTLLKNKNKDELKNIVYCSLSQNVNLGYIHHLIFK